MSASERFEVPQLVGTVKIKAGEWRGDPRQAKEKIREATARAFQKTRLEMLAWMQKNVPQDTQTLLLSGIQALSQGAHRLYFPFEMRFGFPARTIGKKGSYTYAGFVDRMRQRGAEPRKKGTIAPFIEPGKQALVEKLEMHLKAELGEEFRHVDIWLEK